MRKLKPGDKLNRRKLCNKLRRTKTVQKLIRTKTAKKLNVFVIKENPFKMVGDMEETPGANMDEKDVLGSHARVVQHDVEDYRSLPLPFSYKFLGEVFKCTDTVISMLHNRQEVITLEKIKKAVQEMIKKDFKETFLKQIKWLFPAAYKFSWEKEIDNFGARKNDYKLHVNANTDYRVDMMEGRPLDNIVKTFVKLSPNMMVERRRIVENSIIELVKKQHQYFCVSLNPPIVVDETKLLKWHKDFEVDACPPIPEGEFPKKPDVEKLLTAKEVLKKAEELFNLNPRVSEALVKVAGTIEGGGKITEASKKGDKVVETPKEVKEDPIPKHLKGLNSKLIAKILAKEAEKVRLASTGASKEAVKKLER